MSDAGRRLAALGAATLGESGARIMRPRVRAAWPGAAITAPAFTVRCTPRDNLAIHVAVAEAPAGAVLVVNVGEADELGYWGEVLTTAAQARGLAGLVIDGGVRDVDALERLAFPVFSTTIALQGATKQYVGAVGASILCGDTVVDPGDWIVADRDGVAVIPHATFDDVLTAAQARADAETRYFAALQAGTTTIDLLNLDTTPIARTVR